MDGTPPPQSPSPSLIEPLGTRNSSEMDLIWMSANSFSGTPPSAADSQALFHSTLMIDPTNPSESSPSGHPSRTFPRRGSLVWLQQSHQQRRQSRVSFSTTPQNADTQPSNTIQSIPTGSIQSSIHVPHAFASSRRKSAPSYTEDFLTTSGNESPLSPFSENLPLFIANLKRHVREEVKSSHESFSDDRPLISQEDRIISHSADRNLAKKDRAKSQSIDRVVVEDNLVKSSSSVIGARTDSPSAARKIPIMPPIPMPPPPTPPTLERKITFFSNSSASSLKRKVTRSLQRIRDDVTVQISRKQEESFEGNSQAPEGEQYIEGIRFSNANFNSSRQNANFSMSRHKGGSLKRSGSDGGFQDGAYVTRIDSHGSSLNNSIQFLATAQERLVTFITTLSIFKLIASAIRSLQFQIYVSIGFIFVILILLSLVIWLIEDTQLPSIKYYNALHAIFGALGKVTIIAGFNLSRLISKDYTANSFIRNRTGVPLSTVTVPSNRFSPRDGKLLRIICLLSVFAVEAAVWNLLLNMQWTALETTAGSIPCMMPKYTGTKIMNDLPVFLNGDSASGILYNYGIPLVDGLLGGFNGWPLSAPDSQFGLYGPGYVYAYRVSCGNPASAGLHSEKAHVGFNFGSGIAGGVIEGGVYRVNVTITLPEGFHDIWEFSGGGVVQECGVEVAIGTGDVTFSFVADEWLMVSGGQIEKITLSNGISIARNPGQPPKYAYANIKNHLTPFPQQASLLTWISDATKALFNNTHLPTDNLNLLKWSKTTTSNSKIIYVTNSTWKSVTGTFGTIFRYILLQFDVNDASTCPVTAVSATGVITLTDTVTPILFVAILVSAVSHLAQLVYWSRVSGGGRLNDRGAVILNSPLLLTFHLRKVLSRIVKDVDGEAVGHVSVRIQRFFGSVWVRLGESIENKRVRSSYGKSGVGEIVIDEAHLVVGLDVERKYK